MLSLPAAKEVPVALEIGGARPSRVWLWPPLALRPVRRPRRLAVKFFITFIFPNLLEVFFSYLL